MQQQQQFDIFFDLFHCSGLRAKKEKGIGEKTLETAHLIPVLIARTATRLKNELSSYAHTLLAETETESENFIASFL